MGVLGRWDRRNQATADWLRDHPNTGTPGAPHSPVRGRAWAARHPLQAGVYTGVLALLLGLVFWGAEWWLLGVSVPFGVLNWYLHHRDARTYRPRP